MEENNETTMSKQLRPQLSTSIKGSFAFEAEPSPFALTVGMLPQQRRLRGSHGKAASLASGSENLVSLWGESSFCACFASLMWRKFPLILWGSILLCVFQQNVKNPTHIFFFRIARAAWQPRWSPSQACPRRRREASLPLCWLLFSCLINYLPS